MAAQAATGAPETGTPETSRGNARTASPVRAGVWLLAAICLAVGAAARYSTVVAVDTFYDLSAGRYVFAHGIPRQNALTAVAHGAPWIDQQWLAQAIYYASWLAGGYRGVAVIAVVLTAAGTGTLGVAMLRRGTWPTRMFAWTAAAMVVTMASYQIQAQNFGYLLFALTLLILLDDTPGPAPARRTWLVVPVLIVWANLHGSVLIGSGLTALFAGYRAVGALASGQRKASISYFGLAVAAVAAVACTPYGTGVVGYYSRFAGNPELARFISRWGPPAISDPATWIFLAVAIAIAAAVAVAWTRGTRPDPFLAAATLILLLLALVAAGNECWFAFAGCVLAADAQARSARETQPALGKRFTLTVAALLTALAAASLAALAVTPARIFESEVPRRAIAVAATLAKTRPGVRILGDVYTSTAMLWLQPSTLGRDGFDARLEQYPDGELRAYFDFLFARGPAWQRLTSGYGIIAVSRMSEPLARELVRLPGWKVAFEDRDGLVLVRQRLPS